MNTERIDHLGALEWNQRYAPYVFAVVVTY